MKTSFILGSGWVTPSGRGISDVIASIREERRPFVSHEQAPSGASIPTYRIASDLTADAAAFPRLRRSSKISLFALSAAIDAVRNAGLTTEEAARMGVVFAASNGGVIYTRRFFENVIRDGAGAGSPLLFPETVYNSPASHIAAYFKSDAPAFTFVGDSCTGLDAISAGLEMLGTGEVEHCLVLGAEEVDGISADAYARTGLLAGCEQKPKSQAVSSEGAGAIVLGSGPIDTGSAWRIAEGPFLSVYEGRAEIGDALRDLLLRLKSSGSPDLIVASLSGSPLDGDERGGLRAVFPDTPIVSPKSVLGEAMAAAAIQQVVTACNWLLPSRAAEVIVTSIGFGGHVAALRLTRGCVGD